MSSDPSTLPTNAVASSSRVRLDSPPIDPPLSQQEIERGLPAASAEHYVAFSELVDKALRQEYDRLRILTHETLPAANLGKKPLQIVAYSRQARANVLRLLALYRWKLQSDLEPLDDVVTSQVQENGMPPGSAKLEPGIDYGPNATIRPLGAVGKTWSIKALLAAQESQYHAHEALLQTSTERVFKRRKPNPDVCTAVDVLTTGEYRRQPTYLSDKYERQDPKTREDVVGVLEKLDQALAYRMQVEEEVPVHMRITSISDGRVHFRAEGLFDCAVTSLGRLPADLLLLDLKFLFHVREGTTGNEKFPDVLTPDALNYVIQAIANPVLLSDPQQQEAEDGEGEAPGRVTAASKRNQALVRLFNILQHMALSYQLQALYSQARRLERFEWKDKIRCTMTEDERSLAITYWLRRPTEVKAAPSRTKPAAPAHPAQGGTITIAIQPQRDELRIDKAIVPKCSLRVTWKPEAGILNLPVVNTNVHDAEFQIDTNNLDVSELLANITQYHADALIRNQYEAVLRLLGDKPELRIIFETLDDFRLEHVAGVVCMTVKVYNTHWLQFQVNPTTGVLDVREARSALVSGLERRIAHVKTTLAEAPGRLLERVYSLKKQYVLDSLEEKLQYIGIRPTHSLKGVAAEELEKHGLAAVVGNKVRTKALFVLPLPASTSFYLVVVMQEPGFGYAFVGVRSGDNGQSNIGQFGWLEVARILGGPDVVKRSDKQASRLVLDSRSTSFEVESSALQLIHAFANAKVIMQQVERQLVARSIPFHVVGGHTTGLPTIQVKVKDLLPGDAASEISMENAFISVMDWKDIHHCKVQTQIKLRRAANAMNDIDTAQSGTSNMPGVRFDAQASMLVFTPENLDDHVGRVISAWVSLSKLLLIAGEVNRISRRTDLPAVKLVSFSLDRVVCEYGHNHRAYIGFDASSATYDVSFLLPDHSTSNPHQALQSILVDRFNAAMSDKTVEEACLDFLSYLALSLPCLKLLQDLQGQEWPKLVIRDPTSWLLLWERTENDVTFRQGFEVSLAPKSQQFLVSDASLIIRTDPNARATLGKLRPITKFKAYLERATSLIDSQTLVTEIDKGFRVLCDIDGVIAVAKHLADSLNDSAST